MSLMNGRVPPHDLAAEEALLGACLVSPKAREAASTIVTSDDFYRPANGMIWEAISTVTAEGRPVDVVTVAACLGSRVDEYCGGPAKLSSLIAATPSTANAATYAQIIVDNALLRRLISISSDITDQAFEPYSDIAQAVATVRDRLDVLAELRCTEALSNHLVRGPAVLDLPSPQPLVTGVLNRDSFAALYGPPGVGKSLLALDLGLCIASGTWWHRHEVCRGPVLYVVSEGATGLGIRTRAWAALNRVRIPDDMTWLTKAVNLLNPDETRQLIDITTRLAPALVVIDTLNRSMSGGEENSSSDMGTVIAACDRIRQATGACVLIVHHSGKDRSAGLRGHSSLLGAVDTELEVKSGGDNIITFKTSKQKEGPDQTMPLRFTLVPAANSVGVAPYTSRLQDQDGGLTSNGRACLEGLRSVQVPGGVSTNVWRKAVDIPERTFYDQRRRLLELGYVINLGSDKQPRYHTPEPQRGPQQETAAESEIG